MRVTKELHNKILKGLRDKYSDEIKELNETLITQKKCMAQAILNLAHNLDGEGDNLLSIFLGTIVYGDVDLESVIGKINNTKLPLYKEVNSKTKSIEEKRNKEYEEIVLKIQYGKDLSDMISVLEEYGLKF
jgi:hypothetical protein